MFYDSFNLGLHDELYIYRVYDRRPTHLFSLTVRSSRPGESDMALCVFLFSV